MSLLEEFLSKLKGKKKKAGPSEYLAQCPAHKDGEPSLSIKEENGRLLLNCFAGCSAEDICSAVGMEIKELFKASEEKKALPEKLATLGALADHFEVPADYLRELGLLDSPKGVIVPYRNEAGEVTHNKYRCAIKGHPKYRYDKGAKASVYGLERLASSGKSFLVIVEGESDCWILWRHGVPAIGIPGATQAKLLEKSHLKGIENVFVIQEPGEAGEQFAYSVATKVAEYNPSITVRVTKLKIAKDPADLYKKYKDGFAGQFRAALKKSEKFGSMSITGLTLNASEIVKKDVEWLWYPYVPLSKMTLIGGAPGIGKSFFTCELAARISNGETLPGEHGLCELEKGKTLIFAAEDSAEETIVPRLYAAEADLSMVEIFDIESHPLKFDSSGYRLIEAMFDSHHPKLAVFDPVQAFMGGAKLNDMESVRAALQPLRNLAEQYKVAVILIGHKKKGGGGELAVEAFAGSIDFAAIVRSGIVIGCAEEDENIKVIGHVKHNLSKPGVSIAYRIVGTKRGERIDWLGPVDSDAASVAYSRPLSGSDRIVMSAAIRLLREKLAEGRECTADEIRRLARDLDIPTTVMAAARMKLKVRSRLDGQKHYFSLPYIEEETSNESRPE